MLPILVFAIQEGKVPSAGELGINPSPVSEPRGFFKIAGDVVKYVYIIFFIIAVLFIIVAAFTYLTKAGQPEEIKKAHTQLVYAVIAIVVALLAVGAEAIIKEFLGRGGGGVTGGNVSNPQYFIDQRDLPVEQQDWESLNPGEGIKPLNQ